MNFAALACVSVADMSQTSCTGMCQPSHFTSKFNAVAVDDWRKRREAPLKRKQVRVMLTWPCTSCIVLANAKLPRQ
jgi:hypothetical protein